MKAVRNAEKSKGIITKLFDRSPMLFIGGSFALIVSIMMLQVLLSLSRLDAMHDELENVVTFHNEKIELVQTMRYLVRERMIAMLHLVIEEDPFQRDEITQNFSAQANRFIEARNSLYKIAQTDVERSMFDELQKLTVIGTPFQVDVVELLNKDNLPAARVLLREKAMPAQLKVVQQCDAILEYYKKIAHEVEERAHAKHENTISVLEILGASAALISLIIALMVLTRTKEDRDALQQAHDGLEQQVAVRTEELRLSVKQLAEAQRISHIGHWDWHPGDEEMKWSDEMFQIFGYDPQSFKPSYEALLNAIASEDQQRMQTAVNQLTASNDRFDFEYHIVQPSGNERIVHQQASVEFDKAGKLQRVLGTIQDVTDSKAAEQGLQLAARVFENAGEGIIVTDANNNIIDVNKAFTDITGFEREDVVGKNPRILNSGKQETSFYSEMWDALLQGGSWRGELWNIRKSGEIYPVSQSISSIRLENGKIINYLAIFRDISDAKKHEESLWKLGHYDNLCGIANRSLMYANLRQNIVHANRDRHLVAFMMIDLDYFKTLNDTLGHNAGDQMLIHVANQLKASVRECDTVARLGGDEFTVILGNMTSRDDVARVVDKIQKSMGSSLTLKSGERVGVSASIGVAIFPEDADDIESLMKCADRAMYHAKELGRNNAQIFKAGMGKETRPESPTV